MRCSCLKCEHEIPVCDKVCPECGGKQPELIAARLREIDEQCQRAESLRSERRYQEALDIAQDIVAIEDQRIDRRRPWALEFVVSIQAEWDDQLQIASRKFQESEKLLGEGRAKQAYLAVESMVDIDLHPNQRELRLWLKDLVAKENEIAVMVKGTKARGALDVQGIALLYAKVAEYLELNPAHKKMVNLNNNLVNRLNNAPMSDLIELPKSHVVHLPEKIQEKFPVFNSVGILLNFIPSGSFLMGEGSDAH